ncbi:hypothetical protein Pmani_035937 [Petrolisthes manimaculis]|uniref:Uncharacterized protein n=1 Tax=Petrolisthes manimaculis TaxID=1843537 RepID=A0AAE1NKR6_9EUCA|nr:hypothetical protein Pmani_035937 [Petrolisthes manimaculis]
MSFPCLMSFPGVMHPAAACQSHADCLQGKHTPRASSACGAWPRGGTAFRGPDYQLGRGRASPSPPPPTADDQK